MTDRITSLADYRDLRRSYRWPQAENFNFGGDVIDRWAESAPQQTAIRWIGGADDRTVTYGELSSRSNRAGNALLAAGLKAGERVLVMLPQIVPWWETLIGALKTGLIVSPGTTLLTTADLAYRIRAAGIAAVVTDAGGAAKLEAIKDDIGLRARFLVGEERDGWQSYEQTVSAASDTLSMAPTRGEDPALIYFTSGTTGPPKMVLHSQASYGLGHQITGRMWLNLTETDLHWNISDTGWAKAAWSSLFGPFICGAGLFVDYSPGKFQAARVLDNLNHYPITSMCAAPTIYRMLVQQDLDQLHPLALRNCVAAGEPLNPEIIAVWQSATGLEIRDGYGQTETVLLCGNFPGVQIKAGSMGLPAPGMDVAIIDEAGERLQTGQEGDIAVRIEPHRPLGLFLEYFGDVQATENSCRNGWYVTGDRAYMDEDGYLWFVARADDVITSSAYRIGPFEVESCLLEHPAVAEAAVVGKPDPLRGQLVKAFVVLADGYVASEELKATLQQHVKQSTAPYKYPREMEFLAELPKTVSGKIRRIDLRSS